VVSATAYSSLQQAFDESAAAGEVLLVAERHALDEPVSVPSGLRLSLAAGGEIIRTFSTNPDMHTALLKNPVLNRAIADVVISGTGKLGAADLSLDGVIIGLYGDDIRIEGITVDGYVGSALKIGGDRNRVTGFRAINSSGKSGAEGIRVIGGDGFVAQNCYVDSGDDAFQFVPAADPTSGWYDQSISNASFVDCRGRSRFARLLAVALVVPPAVNAAHGGGKGMTASITNIAFTRCTGLGGRRGLVVINDDSKGDIDGVTFTDCSIDMQSSAQVEPQDAWVERSRTFGGVGRVRSVTFDNVTIANAAARTTVVGIDGAVEEVAFTGLDVGRSRLGATPVDVSAGRDIRFTGGVVRGVGNGGSAIVLGGSQGRVLGASLDGTHFVELPSGSIAVDLANAGGATVTDIHVQPQQRAANVKAARIEAPSSNCVLRDIDTKPLGAAPFADQARDASTVIRDCPGYNPRGPVHVPVPPSGVPVAPVNYDRVFRVTAGASSCAFALERGARTVVPARRTRVVRVPAARSVTPRYSRAPTWTVRGL
jgi:hypothetical protein